jgi:hypothetical protein
MDIQPILKLQLQEVHIGEVLLSSTLLKTMTMANSIRFQYSDWLSATITFDANHPHS